MKIQDVYRIDFLDGLSFVINDTKYTGEESDIVIKTIPDDIRKQTKEMMDWCFEQANKMTQDELKKFVRDLPSGYVRSEVRNIYERRFEE